MTSMNQQILPAVAAMIFDEDGKILLQKRHDVKQWGIISGHVEFGESVEEAILREIYEETATSAEIIRLIGVYSAPESQLYEYADRSVHYITTYFEVKLTGNIPTGYHNEETLELGFFDTNNLPHEMARIHPDWLTDALETKYAGSIR